MKSGSPREQRPSLLMGETRLPFLGKVLVMPMGLLGEGTLALCPCLLRAQMVFPSCLLEVWKKFVCSRFRVRLWGKGILCTSLPGADLGGGRKQGSTWVWSRTRWFILTWRMMSIWCIVLLACEHPWWHNKSRQPQSHYLAHCLNPFDWDGDFGSLTPGLGHCGFATCFHDSTMYDRVITFQARLSSSRLWGTVIRKRLPSSALPTSLGHQGNKVREWNHASNFIAPD